MSNYLPNTILISGATSGIGMALAERYAKENNTLLLTGRSVERLEAIAVRCRQKGAKVIAKAFDIRDSLTLSDWLNTVMCNHSIDLAIANAGVSTGMNQDGTWETLVKATEILETNLQAAINMVYPIIEQMKKRQQGQIALMSSLAAFRGLPQSPAYCASKAAIRVYGESLRAMLKDYGIFVTVICPGFVKTPMSDKLSGPKPLLITAQKAAQIIENKLQKKAGEVVFPKSLKFSLNILNILPRKIADSILVKFKSYIDDA